MKFRNYFYAFAVIILAVLFSSYTFAQNTSHNLQAETTTSVPALTQFHSVIYPLWHKGWAEKDYALLESLVPKIKHHVKNIDTVALTGILRDKQPLWKAQVALLNDVVKEYIQAAEAKENQRLLDAAEKLHMQYEKLVRIIRPVMKELTEFHRILYGLYHYSMPQYDLAGIRTTVAELQNAMTVLDSASLPDRLKLKTEEYTLRRKNLSMSVDSLVAIIETNDKKKISEAVETMHGNYQLLEKTFD
jgi:hypothetical protein